MSKIIEKAFDATKKIIRSVFLGSPNLITSSDLNRQIEAIKYQLDQLDDKTGMVIEGGNLGHTLNGGTLSVNLEYDTIRFKGCQFSPTTQQLTINFTSSAPVAYLCLVAEKSEVTYSDDTTHEIAGAKFADGTSYPAANQIVYKNEALVLTHALSSVENLVGVIGVFTLSSTGNVVVKENFITDEKSDTLAMGKSGVITDFDSSLKGTIANGRTYDEAFSIVENRFVNLSPEWSSFVDISGVGDEQVEVDTDFKFRIKNGILYVDIPETTVSEPLTRTPSHLLFLGDFPSGVRQNVVSYFSEMALQILFKPSL